MAETKAGMLAANSSCITLLWEASGLGTTWGAEEGPGCGSWEDKISSSTELVALGLAVSLEDPLEILPEALRDLESLRCFLILECWFPLWEEEALFDLS